MTETFHAYAANEPGAKLLPFDYKPGPLEPEDVQIRVESCGICHSDISMLHNEWGQTSYPFVPGHEVVGVVESIGEFAKGVAIGQRVGLGWMAGSCMSCRPCMSGNHNLCASAEQTIVGRHGGFSDRVRCHWSWAIPLPAGVDPASAGPLFCGGITVFAPIADFGVKPTHRVGVIGIGGLGHMALQFLNKWGCEVTAFTSSAAKADKAKQFGAHHVVDSRDDVKMKQLAGSFDFILSTVNVKLNWMSYLNALAPAGRLHFVGAVLAPVEVPAFALIAGKKSISGSPLGSPSTVSDMLGFCARHRIAPEVQRFPISSVNEAIKLLEQAKPANRIVLDNE